MSKATILVVEDEKQLSRLIELELKFEGYDVEIAYDGETGLEKALDDNIDLILLDLMLPKLNGVEVCKKIRIKSSKPIIMLTAKSDLSDKVTGLDCGADDYITKPFQIEEVLARIRSSLRRINTIINQEEEHVFKIKDILIDKSEHTVYYKNNEIQLTKKEYDLLFYLFQNKNIALTRNQILQNVWGYDYYGDTNVVDVYIRYIRSKIDDIYNINLVETIRGVGYIVREH